MGPLPTRPHWVPPLGKALRATFIPFFNNPLGLLAALPIKASLVAAHRCGQLYIVPTPGRGRSDWNRPPTYPVKEVPRQRWLIVYCRLSVFVPPCMVVSSQLHSQNPILMFLRYIAFSSCLQASHDSDDGSFHPLVVAQSCITSLSLWQYGNSALSLLSLSFLWLAVKEYAQLTEEGCSLMPRAGPRDFLSDLQCKHSFLLLYTALNQKPAETFAGAGCSLPPGRLARFPCRHKYMSVS